MEKWTIVVLLLSLLCGGSVAAENLRVAEVAKSLQFIGKWRVERASQELSQLVDGDLLKAYNGAADYPQGSGYHVGESKTFARILVSAEAGLDLPAGSDYAKHSISEVELGDVLQRSGPTAHTMVVVNLNSDGTVRVVHANWAAYHRISFNNFSRQWLAENGFQVFKPGRDVVSSTQEAPREQFMLADASEDDQRRGTWRIVVTGDIPYYRISQGTIVSHSGPGGEIWVNESRSVSNTFSTEAGVSAEVISAKVGFSVTASFSRTLQYRRQVSDGKYGYVDLYYKYMVKEFDVYYKSFFGGEKYMGSGKAYKWQAVEFQYRETSH